MDESKSSKSPKAVKGTAKPYRRPRGGDARAVSDLMPEIGRAAFRRFGFVQSSVVSRWHEIVGDRYAAVSEPQCIRFPMGKKSEGTLELIVEGAHAPMMQHVFPEIMERVNRFFGYTAVAKIKMRQGRVSRPDNVHKPSIPPSLKPIPLELGDSLRDIADPELAAVLESLAQSLVHNDSLAKADK
ncbi:DUF721 domain-containing protein [Sphingorhabdus arenilitoris]|uniref:DUF721 domain-containing protein n=1 Tax=Sphingorhabdus arenilitoris TaxID=1490041 RepID=A0ABV8RDN2_9SPHN